MKRNFKFSIETQKSVFGGIILIGSAVLLLLSGFGIKLGYDVALWRIALGLLCLNWLIDSISKLRFPIAVFPLAFLFLIFEPVIAHLAGSGSDDLISNWTVLLAALLMSIGLYSLLSAKIGGKPVSLIVSRSVMYLDGAELENAVISDQGGSVNAYISNSDAYSGGGTIRITNNIGSVRLHIPDTWSVKLNHTDNIGHVSISSRDDDRCTQSITVIVEDNVGSVRII